MRLASDDCDPHNAVFLLCEDVRRRATDDLDREESKRVLALAQAGDAEAIERAVLSMFWWSFRLSYKKTGGRYHDVLDTVQDACVALLRAIKTWDGSHDVIWFTHAHLRVMADLKSPVRERQKEFEHSQAEFGNFIENLDDLRKLSVDDEAEQLRSFTFEAVRKLPSNQRKVAKLTLAGLNPVEIGQRLGITKQAVHQMRNKAIISLRKLVGET